MRFSLHRHRLSYADGLQVFTASSGPVAGLDELYLRAAWSGGEGWGEARANIAHASGLPADRVPALVAEALAPLLGAGQPDHALALLDASRAHPIARNLVECALLDGIAQGRGISVAALIGGSEEAGPPAPIASSQRIFAGAPLQEAVARAARYVAEGFGAITVQIGVEAPQHEAIRLKEIRHVIGEDVHLAVDASGTWSLDEAVARLTPLEGLALDYVEQPTLPGDWAAFARVRARTGLRVMADEGLKTAADVEALMRLGPPFLAHVKLPHAGGPRALLAQAEALLGAGVAVKVGQVNEGALATAATAQTAAVVQPYRAALCGAYRIAGDPARGLSYRRGAVCLAHARGMGVALDAKALPAPMWTMGS